MDSRNQNEMIKYKTLRITPFVTEKEKFDYTRVTKIVDRDRFLEIDDLTPLLVANQYRIYPDEFQNLELLRNRKIAIVGITYLCLIETPIKEFYLDDVTVQELLSEKFYSKMIG